MELYPEIKEERKPDYPVDPLILNRWSSRAMTGDTLSDQELFPLFEAARFAPSSYNNQPWRFLYAKKNTPYWTPFFDLLIPFNQEWCARAAVLGIIFSRTSFEKTGKPSITHAFDTGAAWENLSLEGTRRGLVVHGMEGFDYERASKHIPKDHQLLAMFAIGKKAPKEVLSPTLQAKEHPPSRKKIHEFIFEGFVP